MLCLQDSRYQWRVGVFIRLSAKDNTTFAVSPPAPSSGQQSYCQDYLCVVLLGIKSACISLNSIRDNSKEMLGDLAI